MDTIQMKKEKDLKDERADFLLQEGILARKLNRYRNLIDSCDHAGQAVKYQQVVDDIMEKLRLLSSEV